MVAQAQQYRFAAGERSRRGVDRQTVPRSEAPRAPHMVLVLVGEQQRGQGGRLDAGTAQTVFDLAAGEAGIDEQPLAAGLHENGVAATS